MSKFFIRPSAGLFFGIGAANKDQEKGSGGAIIGIIELMFGALLGGIVGVGNKFGIYSGFSGGLSLLPFLGFGFLGVPVGVHFNRKWGFGIVIPVFMTSWWVALLIGLVAFGFAWLLSRRS